MKANGLIKFEVNLSDTFDEFLFTKEQARAMTEKVLNDVTDAFMSNWRAAAKQALGSTRSQYIKGIQRIDKGKLEKSVLLIGSLNNMLEFGASPFDMKKSFEKSLKKKIKTNGGWYLTIPFRFATPGALGESSAFSGHMPQEIYDLAKKLKPTTVDSKGNTKRGNSIKLEDIPQNINGVSSRKAVKGFAEYTHKSNIYEGIQKNQKTYEKSTQNTYNSFRRVSDKSDSLSWIHSGIKAYDLANRAMNTTDFDTIVNNSVDEYISKNL